MNDVVRFIALPFFGVMVIVTRQFLPFRVATTRDFFTAHTLREFLATANLIFDPLGIVTPMSEAICFPVTPFLLISSGAFGATGVPVIAFDATESPIAFTALMVTE